MNKPKYPRKWNGKEFALFLISKNPVYVFPTTPAKRICDDLQGELIIGRKAVNSLRDSIEFKETVRESLVNRTKDKEILKEMFWSLVLNTYEKSVKGKSLPPVSFIQFLGELSGEHSPRIKSDNIQGITKDQYERMIQVKEQATANKKKRENKNDE